MDTGSQLDTVPIGLLTALGVKEENLFPVATNTVTGSPIDIVGGLLVIVTATNPVTGAVKVYKAVVLHV